MKDLKICVLGGDSRMVSAIRTLLKNNYTVCVFGLDCKADKAVRCYGLAEAIKQASAVILPLPFSTDGIKLFSPLFENEIKICDIIECIQKGQIIIGGKLSDEFCNKVTAKGCTVYDYYTSERLTVLNAVPTAEGAVAIAINETPFTLFGSNCAVFGYGRIGKILAKMLKSLGASVTVYARNPDALTWAEVDGCKAVRLSCAKNEIHNADIIFNTIPVKIINKDILDNTKDSCVVIDLASAPGGIDGDYAKSIKRKVIYALSLPGKVAPDSAGRIIADTIICQLKGVSL